MSNTIQVPDDYKKYRQFKGGDLPPWIFIEQKDFGESLRAITSQYPWHDNIYPFAICGGTDDVAVFASKNKKIVVRIIHLATSKGHEVDGEYESFSDWLLMAVKTTVDFIKE
jgi:hypothetical protein